MEEKEIDKKIEGYANEATTKILNVVVSNLERTGKITQHSKEMFNLRDKWTQEVKKTLYKAYSDFMDDGSWWYKSS